MHEAKIAPIRIFLAGLALLLALAASMVSCTSDAGGGSRQISFKLDDSLKNYSKVLITIIDAKDSNRVLDTAVDGKLADPKSLPAYQVPDSIGADFRIRIQGFDSQGLLAMQSDIQVNAGTASAPVKSPPGKLPGLVSGLASARLSALDVSAGTLNPVFDPAVFAYTVDVAFEADSFSVSATTSDSLSTLTLDGAALKTGAPSVPGALKVGDNDLRLAVLPKGGSIPNVYTLKVRRQAGIEDRLDTIRISAGQLSPAFHPDSLNYAVTVAAEVENLVVLPVAKDPKSKLLLNGGFLDSALGTSVALAAGVTSTITIKVTSVDTTATRTYTLNVKRVASADAALSGIVLSVGTLLPAFDPDLNQYTATVAADQVSLLVKARQNGSQITLNGAAIPDGATFAAIPLDVGLTPLILSVTAPDGKSKRSYSLTLNRASPTAFLASLGLNGAPLDSAFLQTRLHYTSNVDRAVDKISIACQAVPNAKGISGTVDGTALTASVTTLGGVSIFTFPVPLKLGMNTIALEVTAQDGVSKNTYSISLFRNPNTITDLTALSVGAGTLAPAFKADSLNYTDTLIHPIGSISLTAKAKDTAALVIVRLLRQDFGLVKPGNVKDTVTQRISGIGLPAPKFHWVTISADTMHFPVITQSVNVEPGLNLVEVEVRAENRLITKTYRINVFRQLSSVSQLSALAVNAGGGNLPMTPAFASGTSSYSLSVLAAFVTVTPASIEATAAITVNGVAVATGTPTESIPLSVGANTITVLSTSPDGKVKSNYVLNITRTIRTFPITPSGASGL